MAAGEKKVVGISDRWFDNDKVLVVYVAVATEGIDWAAYQDALATEAYPDMPHGEMTRMMVERCILHGDKRSEVEARAMFPGVSAELPYRR